MRLTYVLIYTDERGKKRFESSGHVDGRKAARQRAQKERELQMGIIEPGSVKLRDFLEDSMSRTRKQLRETTLGAILCCVFPWECTEAFLVGHRRAFDFFQGAPHRISYSNSTKVNQGACLSVGNAS